MMSAVSSLASFGGSNWLGGKRRSCLFRVLDENVRDHSSSHRSKGSDRGCLASQVIPARHPYGSEFQASMSGDCMGLTLFLKKV